MKRELGCKYYGRYVDVDDSRIISRDKGFLLDIILKADLFLKKMNYVFLYI